MDSATIRVQDYDIVIKSGALKNVGELLNLKRKVLIVTDSGVPSEYAQIVASQHRSRFIIYNSYLVSFGNIYNILMPDMFAFEH